MYGKFLNILAEPHRKIAECLLDFTKFYESLYQDSTELCDILANIDNTFGGRINTVSARFCFENSDCKKNYK